MALALPCATAIADNGPLLLRGVSEPEQALLVTCRDGEGECFTLLGVAIEGVQAFDQADLSPLYTDYLTLDVSSHDLARIAQRITDHYRRAGYFLSRAEAAPQGQAGIARIRVVEGRITSVLIEGAAAHLVEPYLRGLDDANIADLADVDRRLALASDVPGVRLQSRMEPDPHDPIVHRLIITADLQRVDARIAVDNRGTDNVGPVQAFGRVSLNSLTGAADQVGVAVFTTPEDADEFSFVEASYAYVYEHGGRLRTAVSFSRARSISESLAGADGDGHSVSVGYEHPLVRRRDRGLWLGVGFDARHQENDWFGGSGYTDETRVVRVGLRGFLDADGRSNWVFIQASLGAGILGASGHSELLRSRSDADAQFAKLDFFASHYAPLGRYFGFYGAVSGQWSNEALLQSEEFAAGGLPFGRAYGYGAITGDRGVAGSLELRAGAAPGIDPISFAQGYVFLDGAQIWNYDSGDASLASFGGGLRFTIDNRVIAGFELARPLESASTEDDDWRQFFSLSAAY